VLFRGGATPRTPRAALCGGVVLAVGLLLAGGLLLAVGLLGVVLAVGLLLGWAGLLLLGPWFWFLVALGKGS